MNIDLISGQIAKIHITLETAEPHELYGGTTRGAFSFEHDGETWHVTAREEAVAGVPLCNYDIYARELATGREWVILSGKIIVKPRTASVPADKLHPVEYFITVPVRNSQVDAAGNIIVQGIPGPKGERGEKGEPGEGGMTAEERALLMGAAQRDADNTFTAGNTFTGAVDMSAASVTPPEGWNVADLTPEAIQQVVPMAWGNFFTRFGEGSFANQQRGTALGKNARAGHWSTAVGDTAYAEMAAVVIGNNVKSANNNIAIGRNIEAWGGNTTVNNIVFGLDISFKNGSKLLTHIGSSFTETVNGENVTHTCTTEGTGSITIGAGANTKNNGDTESSNSVTIGCKALNQGADSVVIGAQAKATAGGTVAIGAGAEAADAGAVVFASYSTDRSYKTQLYFSGASSALANTYANGEGIMGYVTTDSAGNVIASGYKKLSALFDEGSMTQPATLDEFGDWVMPKVFQPGTLPQQEYTPLPVYPIVEPEIDFTE